MKEAESMYGWLRHYGLTPSWGPSRMGKSIILLPTSEIPTLVKMQQHDPARFGNPRKYPINVGASGMDRIKVATELVDMAKELVATEKNAALTKQDFVALAGIMKNTGVSRNKAFVKAISG